MIKTWQERCEEHPDHEVIVSEQMIRDRMQEEIDELRQAIAEAEKQKFECPRCGHCCREWVGLKDEEVGGLTVFDGLTHIEVPILADFVRAIEAKLKERNS